MERDFDALAKDLQANLTSMGCINKDVRSSSSSVRTQCHHASSTYLAGFLACVLTEAASGGVGCWLLRCAQRVVRTKAVGRLDAGAVPAVGEGRGVPQEPGLDADQLPRGLPRVRARPGAAGAQQHNMHTACTTPLAQYGSRCKSCTGSASSKQEADLHRGLSESCFALSGVKEALHRMLWPGRRAAGRCARAGRGAWGRCWGCEAGAATGMKEEEEGGTPCGASSRLTTGARSGRAAAVG